MGDVASDNGKPDRALLLTAIDSRFIVEQRQSCEDVFVNEDRLGYCSRSIVLLLNIAVTQLLHTRER